MKYRGEMDIDQKKEQNKMLEQMQAYLYSE